jgi:hypothetical protein
VKRSSVCGSSSGHSPHLTVRRWGVWSSRAPESRRCAGLGSGHEDDQDRGNRCRTPLGTAIPGGFRAFWTGLQGAKMVLLGIVNVGNIVGLSLSDSDIDLSKSQMSKNWSWMTKDDMFNWCKGRAGERRLRHRPGVRGPRPGHVPDSFDWHRRSLHVWQAGVRQAGQAPPDRARRQRRHHRPAPAGAPERRMAPRPTGPSPAPGWP